MWRESYSCFFGLYNLKSWTWSVSFHWPTTRIWVAIIFIRSIPANATVITSIIFLLSCLYLQGKRNKNCQKNSAVHIIYVFLNIFLYSITKAQSILLYFIDTVNSFFFFKDFCPHDSSLLLLFTSLRNNLRIYTTKYFFLPPRAPCNLSSMFSYKTLCVRLWKEMTTLKKKPKCI